jgi:mono/diheme cytochrome c family protein
MKKRTWIMMIGSLFLLTTIGLAANLTPPKKTPELLKEGGKIYEQVCASCHGSKGDGKGPAGAVLKPLPTDFQKPLKEWPNTKGDPQKVFEVISKGIPNSAMVAWTQYSEQQRWALAYRVLDFSKPTAKGK